MIQIGDAPQHSLFASFLADRYQIVQCNRLACRMLGPVACGVLCLLHTANEPCRWRGSVANRSSVQIRRSKLNSVLQLYPHPGGERDLYGLYLAHDLRRYASAPTAETSRSRAFVYSNYVTSLDGRIAVPRADGSGLRVPDMIANDRDWRLFQELAVQADMVITSGRYLRDYAEGNAQEILRVYDDPAFADLKDWRTAHGLTPQPDLAVISASLDFPIPDALTAGDRTVVVFTVEAADPARMRRLQEQAGRVVIAGKEQVQGRALVDAMTELGYTTIYNATGPKVLHLLLADDMLDRLYLTQAGRLLGGDPFSTIVDGPLLDPPIGMRLSTLYYDPHALDGIGQLLGAYDRVTG